MTKDEFIEFLGRNRCYDVRERMELKEKELKGDVVCLGGPVEASYYFVESKRGLREQK